MFTFVILFNCVYTVNASNNYKNYKFKIDVSSDFKNFIENDDSAIRHGNKEKLDYSSSTKSWLNMELKVDTNIKNSANINGNILLHINNDTLPFTVEGNIDEYTLANGNIIYYGPYLEKLRLRKKKKNVY